jgi:hypothetical protein
MNIKSALEEFDDCLSVAKPSLDTVERIITRNCVSKDAFLRAVEHREKLLQIVQALPKIEKAKPYWRPPFKHGNGTILDANDNRILDVRGWGYLTGGCAHALDDDKAIAIQDEVGEAVAKVLNIIWGLDNAVR